MAKASTISPKHSMVPKPGMFVFSSPSTFISSYLQCYWSLQDGNGTITWSDALLTPAGVAQAQKANQFWHSQILTQKIPTPESYYTSPLLRCTATALTTFSGLELPLNRPFVPTIKELFRESIGAHTCDRRSSKSVIHANYPTWPFEEGFEEEDPLWSATERETDEAQDQRSRVVLDDVFSTDDKTYISISSHSGQISSILRGKLFYTIMGRAC
jgi:broad specificity phosphatase PhoE